MTNQNFRVKKGLEVGLGGTFLYVDSTGVGINSTAPRESLDVPGTSVFGVSTSTAAFESIGIASFRSNVIIDGDLELLGDLFFDEFEARNGNIIGVITTKDFRSTGIATFNDVVIEGNLTVDGSGGGGGGTEITEDSIETEFLNVTGVTTTAELVVSGISTFIGTVTTDDLFVQGTISADVGSFEFTELTGENLLYSGIATISQKVISNVGVFTSLDVEYADDAPGWRVDACGEAVVPVRCHWQCSARLSRRCIEA